MLAIIGGTGLSTLDGFNTLKTEEILTPFSSEPVKVTMLESKSSTMCFLPRHGKDHAIPPHRIDYRANIWALKQCGVSDIVAVNAVGGIHKQLGPGGFCIPDQIIDYTWGRRSTFFEDDLEEVTHIDFTHPFDEGLRIQLKESFHNCQIRSNEPRSVLDNGVYACTQGPRLETAAEIKKLSNDGCDLVGMTAMPEAALARELDIRYCMLALSVNWGAGITEDSITMEEIHEVLDEGMTFIKSVLENFSHSIGGKNSSSTG